MALFFAVVLSGFGRFLGGFKAVFVGMDAELVPVGFREVHPVVFCGFFDVGEGEGSIGLGDIEHLVESRYGVADVLGVGHGLLALVREGKDRVGQIASRCEIAVFFVGLPSGVGVGHGCLRR